MRHHKKKVTLDRKQGPRRALLRQLATSVVLYEKVATTAAKAKAVQPIVERAITLGKGNTLVTRRRLSGFFLHDKAVRKILEVLSPKYKERQGGYTRIVRLPRRLGDGAAMAQISFL